MSIFKTVRDQVIEALEALVAAGDLPAGLDTTAVALEPPRQAGHGEMATNAALVLAKPARRKPRDLAEALAAQLRQVPEITAVEVAGPGFVNLTLAPAVWRAQLRTILQQGQAYGASTRGQGIPVNVEYVSANPTGPLHAAHARGAVVGDALAGLLAKAGYEVTKEYYINDAGAQVDILGRSTHLRYREALGERIEAIPAGYYPGDYLKEIAAALAARDGAKWRDVPESAWLPVCRDFAIEQIMVGIKADLAALGVTMDRYSSERALVAAGAVDAAHQALEQMGHIYVGVLEPPKGKLPEDWEPRPQTLFRATAFGDDVDRPLRKSDGSGTYFANDIAYHYDKYRRGFRVLIDVLGADHGGYVKRMQAAVTAITGGEAALDVKLCQLVHLLKDGQPVKMSKRAGTFITLRDVIDEVGCGVVRFIMLTRRNDQTLEFDFTKVTEKSKENPVFYVQYAHARCHSVFRNAVETMAPEALTPAALADAPLNRLEEPDELELIRVMASWPRTVESAAEVHEPHRIAFYLYDLASAFHALWTRGKDDVRLRFLHDDDPDLTRARLALVQGVATVIASGLAVIGVEPLEELRS